MPSRFGVRAEILFVVALIAAAALFAYMQQPHPDICQEIAHTFYLQTHSAH